MEPDLGPHGETLPLDAIERMVRARRAFESAWKSGSEPSIEEALGESQGHERAQLLQDLIALDFDHRRQRGEKPNRESYQARFSGEASLVKTLFAQLEAISSSSQDAAELHPGEQRRAQPLPIEPIAPAAYRSVDPRRLLGTSIGPYRLLDILGEGGMGVVYLAEQREPIHRRGALKVIKLGMDTKEVIARFEVERQALAMMSHPSIAKVLDAGSTPDGRPYFVMEHVPGEPITQYCDRHRLSTKERLELFLPVCDAVQHAHQKAIIHRDIKPSNVLVMLQDGKPVPKVIDFGVAKATAQRLTEKTIYTELGQIIGTPEYMSPEQAERGGLDIDTRTDIYSLGVLLYELLTGELPFSREELRRAGYAEIQRIIREREPPKPSTRLSTVGDAARKAAERRQTNLERLLKDLRGDLDWVVMKALEKDRGRRFSSASELGADIQRHLAHELVLARPPSATYRLRMLLRKYRRTVAAAGIVFLTLVVGLISTTAMYFRVEIALGEKNEALKREEVALQRSKGVRLVAQSSAVLPTEPGLALLLAIEGAQREPGLLANNALLASIQAQRERSVLMGHTGKLHQAVFSPDGKRVVTVSEDKTARIWDAELGKEILTLKGHKDGIQSAAFSLDGELLVTASRDKTARIWDAKTGNVAFTLRGHEKEVHSAVFSLDGKRVVTASRDKTARIWDAKTGKALFTLRGHEAGVNSASFNSDGKRVVTASEDHTVRIWDAEMGKEIFTLRGHEFDVRSAAFSPDGKRVVTASGDHTARIWDAEMGNAISTLRGHEDEVLTAAFSPDGKRVVTASQDRSARIWDAELGKQSFPLRGHGDGVLFAVFSPDGKRVVTVSSDKTARIWDAELKKEILTLRGHEDQIFSAAFSPDGKRVVTASWDKTARIWDAEIGKEIFTLRGHGNDVYRAAFSPDGKRVVTASYDHTARIWDVELDKELFTLSGHEKELRAAAFSPDGKIVVTASWDKTAQVWDAEEGKQIFKLQGHENIVHSVAFSPDGKRVVTASYDKTARIWDVEHGNELATLRGHEERIFSAVFSPDGKRVATASWDKTARIWDAETGVQLFTLEGHESFVFSAAFSPDGKRVVTASGDNRACLWDAETGQKFFSLLGHENEVRAAVFSPDGKRVVTCSRDATARIWDAATGTEIFRLRGHTSFVESAAFSPDGKRVVTASADNTARVWDAGTGKETFTLRGHVRWVYSAAFSPDGKRVVTASVDKTARIWPLDLLSFAIQHKPRDLTPEEINLYLIGSVER